MSVSDPSYDEVDDENQYFEPGTQITRGRRPRGWDGESSKTRGPKPENMHVILLAYGEKLRELHVPHHRNLVREGEFKFVVVVNYNDTFKCLGLLVSVTSILTPCDCIGEWHSRFVYYYYPSYNMRVVAGSVWLTKEEDTKNTAQSRTPYFNRKHPQCMPIVTKGANSSWWLMYNYGIITLSDPFRYDDRVEPVTSKTALDEVLIRKHLFDTIGKEGECKSLSFPRPLEVTEIMLHRLEFTRVQLRPNEVCRNEIINIENSSSYGGDNELFYFGKFCGAEKFVKAREDCFNNSGAPVICGNIYVGFIGDNSGCRSSRHGRFFMYFRFDLAIPFIEMNSAFKLETAFRLLPFLTFSTHFMKILVATSINQ